MSSGYVYRVIEHDGLHHIAETFTWHDDSMTRYLLCTDRLNGVSTPFVDAPPTCILCISAPKKADFTWPWDGRSPSMT